jgi:hypothetical protein
MSGRRRGLEVGRRLSVDDRYLYHRLPAAWLCEVLTGNANCCLRDHVAQTVSLRKLALAPSVLS